MRQIQSFYKLFFWSFIEEEKESEREAEPEETNETRRTIITFKKFGEKSYSSLV